MTEQDVNRGRKNAIISYLTIIGVIIAFYMNNDENRSSFASFHIRQALGLWLTFFLLGRVVGSLDSWLASSSFYLGFIVLFIYGFTGAVSRKAVPVPLLGDFYQKLFSSIQ